MSIAKVHEHIDQMKEQDVETLARFVRQPSVSAQETGIRKCAEMLKEYMDGIGIPSRILETDGQPVVYGEVRSKNPDAKTILFYGHYDVQPAEPLDDWNTPPFEPTIINGRMYGRGTADNKGQFLPHIFAVRSYLEMTGDVPVHCKFILDGEEESGSPSMGAFIKKNIELLKCDLVYNSDGPVHPNGQPEIKHGFRGQYSCQIDLETASHENHSGRSGGLIPNAAIEMCRLINSMIDKDNRVQIEGFYDDVLEPTEFEWDLIDKIPFDPEGLAKVYGVEKLLYDKKGHYHGLMFRPTFNINGLLSGYVEEGGKTTVPCQAMIKIDMRLVEAMRPDDIAEKIRKHVAKHSKYAKVTSFTSTLPSKTQADLPICQAVASATRKYFPNPIVVPTSGGTNPDYVWTKILGSPSVTVPYGNADQTNHAANENMALDYFYKGTHISAEVIDTIAGL